MSASKSERVDRKFVIGGVVARAISLTNGLSALFVVLVIIRCAPNPILGTALAFFLTSMSFHIFCFTSNIYGGLSAIVDYLLGTQLCPRMSLFSFRLYNILGKVLHGYEIHGKENIPRDTGGLIVFHHNLLPYDLLYLMSDYYLERGKPLSCVMHRDMEMLAPGMCKVLSFFASKELLIKTLKRGGICAVAPGGGFEAVFSRDYELLWNGRIGFAAVAKECGVPIIPMFTANGQEAMPIRMPCFRDFFLKVYEKTRHVPFIPLVQLPSKLRVYLGEPMFCGADESPAEFAKRTAMAIYRLRNKYQRPDATPLSAFLERFGYRSPSSSACGLV